MGFGAPKGAGTLYTVVPDGTVETKLEKVTISNGLSGRPIRNTCITMILRPVRWLVTGMMKSTGEILFDGVAVTLPPGSGAPDGMTIDSNDNLWVAQWGGFGVYCYNPYTGELLGKVEVPAPNVASCAFGGKDMDTLYLQRHGRTFRTTTGRISP